MTETSRRGHAICLCCLERTHAPGKTPTITLGSAATFGTFHECAKCGTICTLPGCSGLSVTRGRHGDRD